MWRSWVRAGLLVLSVVLAGALLFLLASRRESVPRAVTPGSLDRADAGIDHFTFLQSRGGTIQWQVQAQQARIVEAEHQANLQQVEVTLYGAKGWEMKLKGDEGTINTATKNFTLVRRDGPIAVQLQNGYTIYTNHLSWHDDRREVSTSDPVTIVGDGVEIKGRGLVGKLDSEEFKVLEDVHVDIAP
ncbi:MAG: LPS export ABC transporter periplasmic protein LptC [Nitrospiraceae bacterium]